MTFQMLIGVVIAIWLMIFAACVLALRWSIFSTPGRFVAGLILSLAAVAGSYWGLNGARINYSETVNGQVQRHFDSKWFFLALLVLSGLALALTLWRKWTSPASALPQ